MRANRLELHLSTDKKSDQFQRLSGMSCRSGNSETKSTQGRDLRSLTIGDTADTNLVSNRRPADAPARRCRPALILDAQKVRPSPPTIKSRLSKVKGVDGVPFLKRDHAVRSYPA